MIGRGAFLAILAAVPLELLIVNAVLVRLSRALASTWAAQSTAFYSMLAGFPLLLGMEWLVYLRRRQGADLFLAFIYMLTIYACLSFFYFCMFNLSETSRRLRILTELYLNGDIRQEHLERRYPPLSQVDIRLKRLLGTGQIEMKDGRYFIKSRLLWSVAVAMEWWRKALDMPK